MTESILIMLSALGALVVVGIQASLLSWVKKNLAIFELYIPSVLVSLSGLVFLISGMLTERNLQLASLAVNSVDLNISPYVNWISRVANLFVLSLGGSYLVVKIIAHVWRSRDESGNALKWSLFPRLSTLFLSFVFMYFISQVFGTEGGFEQKPVYWIIAFSAMLLSPGAGLIAGLRCAKLILLIYMVVSVLYIALDFNQVLAPGYKGVIPGFSYRFWGLAPHANAIGPLAALLLFLEVSVPSRSFLARSSFYLVGTFVLIISQSKTSIGAAMVGMVVASFACGKRNADYSGPYVMGLPHVIAGFALSAATLVLLMFSIIGMPRELASVASKINSAIDFSTMSGRSDIWRTAIYEFERNPMFGYGLGIWGADFRASIGMNYAYHAHNQLLQSMSESGVCGILGFGVFFVASLLYCFKARVSTYGGSVAIFLLFTFRCITEAPLKVAAIGTGETFFYLCC